MNLEKLTINNINSFEGEFVIDFTKFHGDLFLISGATGSGKSTIIDSILAALYDKTPRLSSSKYLLNENSKSGKIELDFKVDNRKYKIIWSVKRDLKGNINSVKRELFENGVLIADKSSSIKEELLRVIKLDFPEFTKAVVLAQGQFDAFLSAKDTEKTKILEKILNLKEYELISAKIYEKTKEVERKLEYMHKNLERFEIPDIENIKDEIKNLSVKSENLIRDLKKIENELFKKRREEELLKELEKLRKEIKKYNEIISEIEDELKIIDMEQETEEFERFKKNVKIRLESLQKSIEYLIKVESLKKSEKNVNERIKKLNNILEKAIQEKNETFFAIEKTISEIDKIEIIEDKRLEKFDEIYEIYLKLNHLNESIEKRSLENEKAQNLLKKLKSQKKEYEKDLEEIEKELEYLKAKVIVLEYENARKELKDSQPCPLCGSIEHPYVKNPPNISEEVKTQYESVKRQKETILNKLEKIEKEIIKTTQTIDMLKNDDLEEEKVKLLDVLCTLNVTDVDALIELKKKKESNEKRLSELTSKKEKLEIRLFALDSSINEYKNELKSLELELGNISSEIQKLTSLKEFNPDAKKEKGSLEKEFQEKEKNFEFLKRKFEMLTSDLKTTQALKTQALKKEGEIVKQLELIKTTDVSQEEKELLENELKQVNKQLGSLEALLQDSLKKLEEKRKLQDEIEKESARYSKLKLLNEAIGSKSGDKFKKIAINYMIDSLLNVANLHLNEITNGRYLFEQSDNLQKLELFIVDRYYGNKKRSVSTLSGGEKFLASLSLSFALSDMVREKVEIDFMFLDEGFGTLDSESLNTALEILKKATFGKSVGIISHVESLKEEISKQIKVIKKADGRSEIKIIE